MRCHPLPALTAHVSMALPLSVGTIGVLFWTLASSG